MGCEFHIDADTHTVYLNLSGSVSTEDFFRYQDACYQHADFDPHGCELIDVSGLKSTTAHFNEMSEIRTRDQWQSDSRRALVAPSPLAFGMAMMFKTLSGSSHGKIKIFRDMQKAREWLGLQPDG